MPYRIEKRGSGAGFLSADDRFFIVNKETGQTVGRATSREGAQKEIRRMERYEDQKRNSFGMSFLDAHRGKNG